MISDLFAVGGISYERLNTLLKLSEGGSLIKAADNDLGKQSRMSHQLKELSEYFGTELTQRSGKSVKLTEAGESLVRLARDHFLALQAFRNQVKKAIPNLRIAAGDSLLQWLLVPAIGRVRRPQITVRFELNNLRTNDIVGHLIERQIEFGVLRSEALVPPLQHTELCEQTYAVFVPRRLVRTRGMVRIEDALLRCPHAAIGGDGRLMNQVRELALKFGGAFAPELICDSIGQCVEAVRTGTFAAVLPVHAWVPSADIECIVVEGDVLDALKRKIVWAWHPRTAELLGPAARSATDALVDALRQQGASLEPQS